MQGIDRVQRHKPVRYQEALRELQGEVAVADAEQVIDVVSFVIGFESGELDEDEIVAGFQQLINDGTVWQLQGVYGRTAASLIEAGLCTDPHTDTNVRAEPKPEKIGTHCECGAPYVFLKHHNAWGYACAR
jgi:hypothetical protein